MMTDPRTCGSMEPRLHLLAQQLHRAHDPLVRDQASGVELGEDAGEAELISEARKIVGDNFRGADDRAAATCLLPGEVLQPLGALDPPRGVKDAGAVGRFFEPRTQIAVEIHQALLGVGKRLFEGVSDIHRSAQIDLALARVAGGLPGLAVGVQIRQDLVEGAAPRPDKDRITLLGGSNKRILAIGCDADRRMRLAVGLWHDADVFVIVVFSGEREPFLGPGSLDDFEHFGKAFRALAIGNAVGFVRARKAAAADPENQPAMADMIDGGAVFGQPQRLAQWQNLDAGTDLDVLGTGGDRARDRHRDRTDRPFGRHVDLGQPDSVETPALGGINLIKGGGERLSLGLARTPLKLVEHAKFETHRRSSCYFAATTCICGSPAKAGMMSRAKRRICSRDPPKLMMSYSTPPFRSFSSLFMISSGEPKRALSALSWRASLSSSRMYRVRVSPPGRRARALI